MHVPRIVFLHLCRWFSRRGLAGRTVLRWMLAREWLARWPTAAISGHLAAVLARKAEAEDLRS